MGKCANPGDQPDVISRLSPSEKLVLKTLQYNDQLSHEELRHRTRLSDEGLRRATIRLQTLGIIMIEEASSHSSQRLYSIDNRFTVDSVAKQDQNEE